MYARTSKAKERGGEISEAALTTEPPSWYLRRIVWYSNHRKLRGLQEFSRKRVAVTHPTKMALAEMSGLFAFRQIHQVVACAIVAHVRWFNPIICRQIPTRTIRAKAQRTTLYCPPRRGLFYCRPQISFSDAM